MIIDSHQHFWIYDSVRDSWIDETMRVIRKDFFPKDLKPILEANNVDGCIAVQADQSEKETEFLLECAQQNTFIKGVVGWVDLCDENIEERLIHFTKNKHLKGIRHIVQAEKDDFVLGKDFQRGISKLNTYNLVYDILVFPNQLESAIKLVEQFPNQKFVLDHIAKPQISKGLNEKWVKNIKQLAAFKNVACKISGMVTETDNFNWTPELFMPFLDTIVNAFGTKRIMFGSDWPVCLLAGEYKSILQIIENYFIDSTEEDMQMIMGGNAIKIYNL